MSPPVAIITGASQGIGAGLAAGYRRAGYAVVGVARSLPSSNDDDYVAIAGDLADAATAQRAADEALDPMRGGSLWAPGSCCAWRRARFPHMPRPTGNGPISVPVATSD